MWYSLSGVGSFGFAPKKPGVPWGDGEVTRNDDAGYQSPYYYTGTIVINGNQYNTLQSWREPPDAFNMYYIGGAHDCINFVWAALAGVGLNPDNATNGVRSCNQSRFVPFILNEVVGMGNKTGPCPLLLQCLLERPDPLLHALVFLICK
jgi:hypothetical protein